MQMKIYQIGGITLALESPDIIDSSSYSGSVEGIRPLSSIEDIVRDTQYVGQKNRSVKIELVLLSKSNVSADTLYQYMLGIIGKPIPVIAYHVHDDVFKRLGDCVSGNCCLTWLSSVGVVDKVPDLKQDDPSSPPTMTIQIEIFTYWQTINQLNWRWMDAREFLIQNISDPTVDFEYEFPSCRQLFDRSLEAYRGFKPIQYSSYDHVFDPVYMLKSINSVASRCVTGGCSNEGGSMALYLPAYDVHYLDLATEFYNAPPKPIIVVESFYDTSDVLYRATGTTAGITKETYQTTIRVSATNTVLNANGYTSLDANDKIVVGDFTFNKDNNTLRNALIIKNGTILSDVQPVISNEGFYCGYTPPANDAQATVTGNIGNWSAAYYYRRM